jgi:flagellar biogenesis protein FliO
MTRKVLLLIPFLATVASADVKIETIDRGDTVEVIARDVTATNMTITPVRSRLEVAVSNKPKKLDQPSMDSTIVVTELESDKISIKLAHDRSDVKAIAPFAKAIQVGNDLHVLIPRTKPVEGFTLPEPTGAKVEPIAEPKIEAKAEAKPEAKPEPTIEAKPEAAAPAITEAKPPIATKPDAKPPVTTKSSTSPFSKASTLGVLALAAIGLGVWLMKRKKTKTETGANIEVIAQKPIGAKAKVVWLTAGTREMVLAVTPQQVRMLSEWDAGDAPPRPRARTVDLPQAQAFDAPVKSSNPSVAGILKLRKSRDLTKAAADAVAMSNDEPEYPRAQTHSRAQTQGRAQTQSRAQTAPAMQILDDDIASGDLEADTAWAKEILAATRSHGYRR